MGILVCGDLAGLCRERRCCEVWVFQSVDGVDAFPPVELEELRQERDGHRALAIGVLVSSSHGDEVRCMIRDYSLFEYLWEVAQFIAEALHAVASWKGAPSRHVLLSGSPHQGEDELSLIEIAAAGENWLAFEHLAKNAPIKIRNGQGRFRGRFVANEISLPNSPHVNRRCIPTKLQ